jgi:hypothetical protein
MSKRRSSRRSASGVRNVYFENGPHTRPGRVYRVRFRHLGKRVELCSYDRLEDAQAVAEAARERLRSSHRRASGRMSRL